MIIVAVCESCHSRFRVKKTLLDGAFAIRFRCRACDGHIIVRNPEMRKLAAVPSPAPPPSSDTQTIPAAPAGPSEPKMPPFASVPAAPPPNLRSAVRLEDLVPCSSEEEERARQDIIGATVAVQPVARRSRPKTFKRSAGAMGMLPYFAGVGIFLIACGAYYFFRESNPGGNSPGEVSSFPRSSSAANAQSKPAYEVRNLNSYTPRNAIAGNLFVITGTVRNVGNAPARGIRVRATLFGKDRSVLIRQASIAGNYIDEQTLPHMARTTIEGYLAAVRNDKGGGSHDLPPGKSLRFIVVCFEPPGKVEGFEVLATDAEP